MPTELAELILAAVSNDFESLETIVDEVTEQTAGAHNRAAIAHALDALIRDGRVEAYRLSPLEPHTRKVNVKYPFPDDVWFYIRQ